MNSIRLLIFASFFHALAAWAQTPAPPNPSELAPHWCEDLGLERCFVDEHAPQGSAAITDFLKGVSARRFLPEKLATIALACEQKRQTGDRAYVAAHCGARGPLARAFQSWVWIPRETTHAAELPRSGARLVIDCSGRHLQMRADLLPLTRQLRQIKNTLTQLSDLQSQGRLPSPQSAAQSASQTVISMALGGRTAGGFEQSQWLSEVDVQGRVHVQELAFVPRAYVSNSCWMPAVAAQALGAGLDRAMRLQAMRQLFESLIEYRLSQHRNQALWGREFTSSEGASCDDACSDLESDDPAYTACAVNHCGQNWLTLGDRINDEQESGDLLEAELIHRIEADPSLTLAFLPSNGDRVYQKMADCQARHGGRTDAEECAPLEIRVNAEALVDGDSFMRSADSNSEAYYGVCLGNAAGTSAEDCARFLTDMQRDLGTVQAINAARGYRGRSYVPVGQRDYEREQRRSDASAESGI